jgi:Mycothiol maleylpyruvate isomerase N-terminal domain
MLTYEEALDTLDRELQGVADTFADLSAAEWQAPTLLEPFEPDRPRWTVFELAGHLTISIGLTSMLIADQQAGQPGRDQVSFFIFPRSEVAPGVYDYAYVMVEGKKPGDMPGVLRDVFSKAISESRALPAGVVGSGYYALMRLDEFVSSRIVEAVVHGIDLTDATGRTPIATPEGIAFTASLFDELLARRTVAGRPADLVDDLAWVRAASGRSPHPDPRLPLLG